MWNLMHYHTSDSAPTILEQHKRLADGRKALRDEAKRRGAKKAGADRYEVRSKGYGTAVYLEEERNVSQ